jgi:hypothetical protein
MKPYLLNTPYKQGNSGGKGNILARGIPKGGGVGGVLPGYSAWFWEVTVSVIVRKQVYMNMCLILNGYRDRAA